MKKIITELEKYLPTIYIMRLKSITQVWPRGIVICCVVSDIIKNYNASEQDEQIISELLSKLLKLHFSPKNIINQNQQQ